MPQGEIKNQLTLLHQPLVLPLLILTALLNAVAISRFGTAGAVMPLLLFAGVFFLAKAFAAPKVIMLTYLVAGFLVNGITRYLPDIPISLGLTMDFLLLLGVAAALHHGSRGKMEWPNLQNVLVLAFSVWFLFTAVCALNPESKSLTAWFYAMRGTALYFWLAIPLVLLFFNRLHDLRLFIYIWGIFSILAFIKGYQQIHLGPDLFEKRWLDSGGAITHYIWGRLRAFSFYSDAGQFGAAQAHAGITFLLLMLKTPRMRDRLFFGLVALTGFYGMLLSGTRGAIFIPLACLFFYGMTSRHPVRIALGVLMTLTVVLFFKFTYIGQSNDYIRRARSAFDVRDASLQVRLQTQKRLADYLQSRPLGGGVGSAGYWGNRFTPGSVLAETQTDSWYVRIWAEQGIIGLTLYLVILAAILIRGIIILWSRIKNPEMHNIAAALLSGCFGIFVASYTNSVLGQSPTGPVIQFSLAFLFLAPRLDKEIAEEASPGERTLF
jgi:O-antigen ligase